MLNICQATQAMYVYHASFVDIYIIVGADYGLAGSIKDVENINTLIIRICIDMVLDTVSRETLQKLYLISSIIMVLGQQSDTAVRHLCDVPDTLTYQDLFNVHDTFLVNTDAK